MSHKKVWWLCKKGHEWEARINNRSKGSGCLYCSGRIVTKQHSLETLNPELAKEWHLRKNGALMPAAVTPMSGKKVWWLCKKGHE